MHESTLNLFCRNDMHEKAMQLLTRAPPPAIDVLEADGINVRLAVKYDRPALLAAVVRYHQRSLGLAHGEGTTDYNIGRHRLKRIVADALGSFDASPNVLAFLREEMLLLEETTNH